VPEQSSTWLEHSREFRDHLRIVSGVCEETERCEKIEYSLEAILPASGEAPHVAVRVTETRTGSALARDLKQLARVIQRIDIVTRLGEKVGVPPLATRNVEYPGADWKSEEVDEPRDFRARSFGCE
jgi:hypothetical protein